MRKLNAVTITDTDKDTAGQDTMSSAFMCVLFNLYKAKGEWE